MSRPLRVLRSALIVATLAVSVVASHAFGLVVQWAGAVAGACLCRGVVAGLSAAWWGLKVRLKRVPCGGVQMGRGIIRVESLNRKHFSSVGS